VSFVGAVGEDGTWLVRELEGYGVSTANISVVQGVTGRAIIQLTPAGENCIVLHKGANFALPDPPAQSDVEQHLTGISHLLLQNEIPWASTLAYLLCAHGRGLVTIFNPSPMPVDAQLHAFPWASLTWLVVNEGEAESLLRVIGGNLRDHIVDNKEYPANWPDDNNLRSAFSTLIKLCRREPLASTSVVCTLGTAGVLTSIRGLREMIFLPAVTLEGDVRDTTGAGDCFTGYFVASLMQFGNNLLSKDEAVELLRFSVQVCQPRFKRTISTQQYRRLECV